MLVVHTAHVEATNGATFDLFLKLVLRVATLRRRENGSRGVPEEVFARSCDASLRRTSVSTENEVVMERIALHPSFDVLNLHW